MCFGFIYRLRHEVLPGHLRHGQSVGEVGQVAVEQGGMVWGVGRYTLI